jgi:hypothetical protein
MVFLDADPGRLPAKRMMQAKTEMEKGDRFGRLAKGPERRRENFI